MATIPFGIERLIIKNLIFRNNINLSKWKKSIL